MASLPPAVLHAEAAPALDLLTVPQVMARLQLGRSAVYDLLRSGQLASITLGRARRIPAHALTDFIHARLEQEAAGYVLAPGNTRKRVRVYGTTRKDALAKLTEKIAASNLGLPVAAADSTVSTYLTYWLNGVAVHHVRENTHTRYAACVRLHLNPGLGAKKLARLTARDVRTFLDRLRVACQCCTQGRDTGRRSCCAIGQCCNKRLSPLTVTYVHSVLKSALEHAVREDDLPRNVARNVKTPAPRPRRFKPFTSSEARQFLHAASSDRLHALYELALRTGLRKGELLGLHWDDLDLNTGTAALPGLGRVPGSGGWWGRDRLGCIAEQARAS